MLNRILDKISEQNVRKLKADIAQKVAEEYKDTLIKNMRSNKFNFKLAMSTIRKRLAAGKGDTPFIFTEAYINAIVVKNGVVTVKRGRHYSGLTYKELSFILEYGRRDKHIPARPIWRLTLEDMEQRINELAKGRIKTHFNTGKKVKRKR